MKLAKYQHACFTIEQEGKLLVVDPGILTQDLGAPENVIAIVITHEHSDHFDTDALGALLAHNPEAIIYAHESITSQLDNTLPHQAVASGDEITAGPFQLRFDGGEHATIHPSLPVVANLGVHINDRLYYPGDALYRPEGKVEILALPAAAPWCKIWEIIDYVNDMEPSVAFPTHDAILSDSGKTIVDSMLSMTVQKTGGEYRRLDLPIEI